MHSNNRAIWRTLKPKLIGSSRVLLTASSVASCVILLRMTGILQTWEWTALDQFFCLRPPEPLDERIVVVGITEADLQTTKQWPISDAKMAHLLQKIQTYKPRTIGLDIYRDLPVAPGHSDLLKVYQTLPNLIGIEKISDKNDIEISAPPILGDRNQAGFNNLMFDADGKVRRGLLYWNVDGNLQESFALKLALNYLASSGVVPQDPGNDSDAVQLGKVLLHRFEAQDGAYIQADDGGYQILANLRARSVPMVSMTEVLEGRVHPDLLRDRLVLVGSTAISLKDFFYTSYSHTLGKAPQTVAGVELQANLASQLISAALDGRGLINVWSDPLEWLWIALWSWVGADIVWRLRSPHKSAPTVLLAGVGLGGICYGVFLAGWWLPLVPATIALAGSAVVVLAHLAHLEEELKRSKEFLNSIINTIPDPIFVKDRQHRWIVLNQAYCKFLGRPLEELLNQSDYDVFSPQEAKVFYQQDQQIFSSNQESESEAEFTDQNGVVHHIATKRSLHKDGAGNLFLVGVIRDITQRKRMEEELKRTAAELVRSNAELAQSANQLRHQANHDPLTGLPNRTLFEERLNQALEWADENNQLVALLFLDLDGFKFINDTYGHDVGDLLLKSVARRLTGCLRTSDTVSRLGGDEFTIILPAIPSQQDAGRVAEKILTTLVNPFPIEEYTIFISTSIGISLFPKNSVDADTLVKLADNAMYEAKELGKNRCEFASPVTVATQESAHTH